jgi:hypothetical protein
MNLRDGGRARVTVKPDNVMKGAWSEDGRWWLVGADVLCVKFQRFYSGEETCRKASLLSDEKVHLADESPDKLNWQLEMLQHR